MTNKSANSGLSELKRSIYRAHKATSAMFTFSILFSMAASATEGDPEKREQFPALADLSSLCEQLAHGAEDAIFSVTHNFNDLERSLR
jgi:hypothetical protein